MIEGKIHPDFWPVARVFRSLLPSRVPGGGALCVYHQGQPVVDVWGGTRDESGTPWDPDTLSLSFSTTKGVASTLLHILADRGLVDYSDPVAKHWPEFAQCGKEAITVRQILCHEAGLYDIRSMVDHASRMLDWTYMTEALARARPRHPPGTSHGYHGLTYGWLVGELIQRVAKKPFTQVLREELSEPLGGNGLHIGMPNDDGALRARLILNGLERSPERTARFRDYLARMSRFLAAVRIRIDLNEIAAALMPEGIEEIDFNSCEVQRVPIPALNGMFSARGLARMYAVLADGGRIGDRQLLSRRTIDRVARRQNRGVGRVIPFPMHWRLGYHRPFTLTGGVASGFGHFGFGGSGAWADPERKLAVALVLNSGVGTPFGDMRIVRVSTAAVRCADRRRHPA
jgi:CubicO group peptidase (beta-lactamase class C family)